MDVVVGMVSDENIKSRTTASLTRMFNAHPEFKSRFILIDGGCADLADSRNKLVRLFLSAGQQWLLTVDSDMVWEPDDWTRLRRTQGHLFVSGTYFQANDPPAPVAMVYRDGGFFVPILTEDSPELLSVHAVGMGFSLIHRDVFLKSADVGNDHEWYEHGVRAPNGKTLPEDYAFCGRVGEAGIPIHLNTKVRVGHIKPRIIGWGDYARTNSGQEKE